MPASPEVIVAIGELLQPLLETMERVSWVQRHLSSPREPSRRRALAPGADEIAGPLKAAEVLDWPDDLRFMRDRLVDVSRQTVELVTSFVAAAKSPNNPIDLYRALRRFARVQETLYPLAPALEPVSRWFLEPERRDDDELVARLREGRCATTTCVVGVLHADNERDAPGRLLALRPRAVGRPIADAARWSPCTGAAGTAATFSGAGSREAGARARCSCWPRRPRDRTWSIMGGEDVDAGATAPDGRDRSPRATRSIARACY